VDTASFWAAIAAIAAASSAGITVLIAAANLTTARTESRSDDFDSCLDVVTKLGDAQRRVFDAGSDQPKRQFEFRELLNLMEALALLENDRRTAKSTRTITNHFLIESYAFLRSDSSQRLFLESSVTGDETFSELVKFAARYKPRIEALSHFYEQQRQGQIAAPT
jgi:hypothetical protein